MEIRKIICSTNAIESINARYRRADLDVDWHTAWDAIEVEAKARTSNPDRLSGVKTFGVNEHIWWPSRIGVDRAVTIIVDLSRDQDGCVQARLLDAVVGRSGASTKPG